MKKRSALIISGLLALLAGPAAKAQLQKGAWASDISVNPVSGEQYKDARVSVSANGTLYVARLEKPSGSNSFTYWRLLRSADTGRTWTSLNYGSLSGTQHYNSLDMMAVGTGATFKIFVARSYVDSGATATSFLVLSNYDDAGTNLGTGVAESYTNNTRGFTQVALAGDYRDKSSGSIPYNISMAAVKAGAYDSVIAFVNANGAATFTRNALYGSLNYIRSLSASLGTTDASISGRGRMGIAWWEAGALTTAYGDMKAVFVYGDDATVPSNGAVRSIGSNATDYRNPTIVLSQNTAASNIKVLIGYESQNSTVPATFFRPDTLFPVSHMPTFTSSYSIDATSDLTVQPHFMYDPVFDNFLMTYYDASTGIIPYKVLSFANAVSGMLPVLVKANYRDAAGTAFADVYPRVDINTGAAQAAFVWNDAGATMFDAEYHAPAANSVASTPLALRDIILYPNPAQDRLTIALSSDEPAEGELRILDLTGRVVMVQPVRIGSGKNEIPVAFGTLPAGNYLVQISGARIAANLRFAVR